MQSRDQLKMRVVHCSRLNILRVAVLVIVLLAGAKIIFHHRSPNVVQIPRMEKEQSFPREEAKNLFWGQGSDLDLRNEEVKLPPEPSNEEETRVKGAMTRGKQHPPLKDARRTQMRLVHLDLKGAAPKVSYYEQIFPLFAKLGANGILIEYEDMFPFHGDLKILRSPYAYSEGDIEKILKLAEINKLEVVPLVQCFGHMEFVLKHNQYKHLREVDKYPNSLNPHAAETLPLVTSILSQILDKHLQSAWVHIGADEVFNLGEGQDSKNWMNSHNSDLGKMYLNHIQAVLKFLVTTYTGPRILMWDDMLRHMKVETIKESGITERISPMIWLYEPDLKMEKIGQYISKYQDSGFKSVWFASAFKGATGPAQVWTPIDRRQKNHQGWLQMIQSMSKFPNISFQGIALTGWQRFDHFSALCELLPVSIPSLAVCLQTLVHGGFSDETKKKIVEMLGFQSMDLTTNTCEGSGAFPGSEIYRLVGEIHRDLKPKVQELLEDSNHVAGWFSRYHRKHRFGNPIKMEKFGSKVLQAHEKLEALIQQLRSQLEAMYFPDTVEEWMEEYVNPHMDPLREFVKDYQEIIKLDAQPKA